MTLDELLADLKAKHGAEWPKAALRQLTDEYFDEGAGMADITQLEKSTKHLYRWIEQMITAGVASTWQPGPEVWAMVPEKFNWITGDPLEKMMAWITEPQLHMLGDWWTRDGDAMVLSIKLPLGVDWRQAIWKRPEVQP